MINVISKKRYILHLLILMLALALISAGCNELLNQDVAEPDEEAEEPLNEEIPEPVSEPTVPEEGPEPENSDEPSDEPVPHTPDNNDSEEPSLPVISDGDYLLALVTKETTLKSDYVPSDLRTVPEYLSPAYSMQLRADALEQLELLWNAAAYDGVMLKIRSAYRSYNTQKGLFQDYANRYGEEEANRFSARAGQSEHQLGTTVDFGGTSVDLKAAFADTLQGQWLKENAHYFGFAMSYPAGKEHITGYIFEPWHYRYIGIEAAAEWKASGETLREYLETKSQHYD
ncbi:MAG: M15 family metallopeptidase [Bacillota bacterium]|nr:M15 family metallopeptidase [Bacillota bacterium]MDW7729278.1 M15 family metallopeptidase [Bacillota bacterium]